MPKSASPRTTTSRKEQHVNLTIRNDVAFQEKTTGLEEWGFVHNALPELNFSEIDTSTEFLGRRLSAPCMVSCMTGGYADALRINRQLAEVCEQVGIAIGVGSQRQALEDTRFHRTFGIVRDVAPSIPVVGNLGAAEIAGIRTAERVLRLVELIRADAFTIHLNPLQELLQPEGSTKFRGVIDGIALLVRDLPVPVIVKEIGAGLSADVIRRLMDVGVRYVDVAGAGGTSWAGVEALRSRERAFATKFWDWGIPTADALRGAAGLRSGNAPFTIIASGGIASGLDAAKCIALGADLVGSARPVLMALHADGTTGVRALLAEWMKELRAVMFLTGAQSIVALQHVPLTRQRHT